MISVFLFSKTNVVDLLEVPMVNFFTKSGSTPEIRRTKVRTPHTDVGPLALFVMEVCWNFSGPFGRRKDALVGRGRI